MKFISEDSFFEAQPMFVCEQASLKILDINKAAIEIFGYSRKKFLRLRLPDLGEITNTAELGIDSSKAEKHHLNEIWKFSSGNGDYLYFQFSGHMINYKGRPAKLVVAHNITGIVSSKKSSRKLLSSQLDIQSFPLAEIEWDANLNVTQWSGKAVELLGYTEKEAAAEAKLLEKIIYEEDQDSVRQKIEEAYQKKSREVSLLTRNVTKEGKTIYCEWYNSMLYDSKGELAGMFSLVHDVTNREKALVEARRSMKSYLDLFNSISDAIYLLNDNGIIVEANQGLEKTFGYSPSEVVGKHNRILSAPGKYDEERVYEIIEEAKHGQPGKYDGWGRKKNGEIFPTEFLVNVGTYFGEEVLIVIERDMTEQRESEEALKQREGLFSKLFNSSPIGIALLNEHREVQMVNDGFEQLFGFRERELKGLELDKVIVPAKRHDDAQKLTEADRVKEVTEKRIRKDGTVLDVIIYAVPVVVEKQVVGIYGIYVDITDRKKAEEQVRTSLREKEVLLAEIHHRVKNNLAVITGLLELQAMSVQNEDAESILKDSQMRIHSIALVHEKLYETEDFSKVEIGQYFKELAGMFHQNMRSPDADVEIKFDMEAVKLPITKAIPCGLLLNEILSNSYKHAFKGREKGVISISLSKHDKKLFLQVRDNGIGLPDNPEKGVHTSLGMTLIKTLAKQLNASFDYRNENGTVFEFEFEEGGEKSSL